MSDGSDHEATQQLPRSLTACATTVITIIMFFTIIGNSIVIALFTRIYTLRSVTNYFVVSLASTDLAFGLVAMPLWFAFLLCGTTWGVEKTFARVCGTVDFLISTVSITTLTAISFDRYLCITKPLRYFQIVTPRRIYLTIGCIWVFSISLAIASVLLSEYKIFSLVEVVLSFFLPLMIIVATNIAVYRVALRHVRQIHSAFQSSAQNPPGKNLESVRRCRRLWLKDQKAAKTPALITGALVICWAPFVIMKLKNSLYDSSAFPTIKADFTMFTNWMHYCTFLINPIISITINQKFKTFFTKHVINPMKKGTRIMATSTRAQNRVRPTGKKTLTPGKVARLA